MTAAPRPEQRGNCTRPGHKPSFISYQTPAMPLMSRAFSSCCWKRQTVTPLGEICRRAEQALARSAAHSCRGALPLCLLLLCCTLDPQTPLPHSSSQASLRYFSDQAGIQRIILLRHARLHGLCLRCHFFCITPYN